MELFILIIFSALSIAIYYLVTDKLGFTQSATLSDSQTATDQMLSRASIQTISIEKNSLQIRLNDFAAPKISLYFENDQIRSFWHVTLRDLRS